MEQEIFTRMFDEALERIRTAKSAQDAYGCAQYATGLIHGAVSTGAVSGVAHATLSRLVVAAQKEAMA